MEALDPLNTYGVASLASEASTAQALVRRPRRSPHCQVIGCGCDLSSAGRYFLKKRICKPCMQAEAVQRQGHRDTLWRYCQQCGKLETLDVFAGAKRSCRKALDRRRATSCLQNNRASPAHTSRSPPQRRQQHHSDSPRSSSGDEDWAAPAAAAAVPPALLQEATQLLKQQPLQTQLSWCGTTTATTAAIAPAAAAPGCHSPVSLAAGGAAVPAASSRLFCGNGSPVSSGTSASLTAAGGPDAAADASADESLAAAAHLAQWFFSESGGELLQEEGPESDADAAMVDMWLAELQLLPAQPQLPQATRHLPPIHEHTRAPQPATAASELEQLEQLIERAMLDAAAATAGAATATSSGSSGSTNDSGSLPASMAGTPAPAWPPGAVLPMVPAAAPVTSSSLEALLSSAVTASSAATAAANQISHAARVMLLRQQYAQLQGAVEGVRRLMQQMALHAAAAGPVPAASVGPGLSRAAHLPAQSFQAQLFPGPQAFPGAAGACFT